MFVPEELKLRKEPKQHRSRRQVEKIMDAALRLLDKYGLSAFNTNALAREAAVDVASIYQYFPNKESILFWTAERWLKRIRAACTEMEKPENLSLQWPDFFAKHGELIMSVPESKSAFSSMQSLWALYPEYQKLALEHEEFMVDFFVRHCRRYGADIDQVSLKGMATYLYLSSNTVIRSAQSTKDRDAAENLLQWNYHVWVTLLQNVLPN